MNSNTRWKHETELALRAVSTVSDLILDCPEDLNYRLKSGPRDVVTDLDLDVERQIGQILAPSNHPILGEESWDPKSSSALPKKAFWLVDPIDGTANFLCGMPLYAVSIGFYDQGFVLGAVNLPRLKELYFTYEDAAYLNGRQLKAKESQLKNAIVVECFGSPKPTNETARGQLSLFSSLHENCRSALRLGSAACSLCFVASGRVQAVVGANNELWDVAGGLAIAKLAGCEVRTFIDPRTNKINYIAAAPGLLRELLPLCAASGLDLGGDYTHGN